MDKQIDLLSSIIHFQNRFFQSFKPDYETKAGAGVKESMNENENLDLMVVKECNDKSIPVDSQFS